MAIKVTITDNGDPVNEIILEPESSDALSDLLDEVYNTIHAYLIG